MSNEDGRVWITYNGEIYNHARFRDELEKAGHVFKTDHSDTEILVHGYEEWGLDGLLRAHFRRLCHRHIRRRARTRSTSFATASA